MKIATNYRESMTFVVETSYSERFSILFSILFAIMILLQVVLVLSYDTDKKVGPGNEKKYKNCEYAEAYR